MGDVSQPLSLQELGDSLTLGEGYLCSQNHNSLHPPEGAAFGSPDFQESPQAGTPSLAAFWPPHVQGTLQGGGPTIHTDLTFQRIFILGLILGLKGISDSGLFKKTVFFSLVLNSF